MFCCTRLLTTSVTAVCMLCVPRMLNGDIIRLKNGGEIRGQILRQSSPGDSGELSVETLSGAIVIVDREETEFVSRRPLLVEHFEVKLKQVPRNSEDLWELADWCREKRLIQQRKQVLAVIIELDPSDEEAHKGLGHMLFDGEWMTRDEYMLSNGYVKYKGRYVIPQELEIIQKSEEELEAEREWHRKVRLWHGWLTGHRVDRRKNGYEELRQITEPNAVTALARFMSDDENKQVRLFYVKILSGIAGEKPVRPLVTSSLRDVDNEVRYEALNAISSEYYDEAIPLYVDALRDDLVAIVRRAADALGRIGDDSVVDHLIDALVTTHRYRVRVQGSNSPTYSFSTDGHFGGPSSSSYIPPEVELQLRTGQYPNGVIVQKMRTGAEQIMTKVVTVQQEHRNEETLHALVKLTGQNLGYDERSWRLWWVAHNNAAIAQ